MPRERTSTRAAQPSPSADAPPTTSTDSSPPTAPTPSDVEQPATESPPAADAQPPDYRKLLANLTLAVDRYRTGEGHWDDVVLCAEEAQVALGAHTSA